MPYYDSPRLHAVRPIRFCELARRAVGVLLAFLLSVAAFSAHAQPIGQDPLLVRKYSPYSVPETMDRAVGFIQDAGGRIFARVDHKMGAESVFETLPPAQVLIFGNPAGGTPLMQRNLEAGLDLPLRVLVYQDAEGRTVVAYRPIEAVMAPHGLGQAITPLQPIADALQKLTDAMVRQD